MALIEMPKPAPTSITFRNVQWVGGMAKVTSDHEGRLFLGFLHNHGYSLFTGNMVPFDGHSVGDRYIYAIFYPKARCLNLRRNHVECNTILDIHGLRNTASRCTSCGKPTFEQVTKDGKTESKVNYQTVLMFRGKEITEDQMPGPKCFLISTLEESD
jgi:hypothetical protein